MRYLILNTLAICLFSFTSNAQGNTVDKTIGDEEVHEFVEQVAQFPGGELAMHKFIGEHLVYPNEAKEKNIQGMVYCSFIVKKNGAIDNIKIVRSLKGGCDEAAIRVIKSMPKWIPGKMNGRAVNSKIGLPIKFQILADGNTLQAVPKRKK